jgi:DNA anti-recombination protein RmuC
MSDSVKSKKTAQVPPTAQINTGIPTASIIQGAMGNQAGTGSNVDKIREILFGNQMVDYEKRFKHLEMRFNRDNVHLRDDMTQRIQALEELLKADINSLEDRAKQESQDRHAAQQDIMQEIRQMKKELTTRLSQLDDQFNQELKQLRQHLHVKFQEVAQQMRQQHEQLLSLMKQEVTQLQVDKVNRADLAAIFTEMALHLNNIVTPASMDSHDLEQL